MADVTAVVARPELAGRGVPLQAVDLAAVTGASTVVRASAAFLLVLALGGALLWRFEPLVERSMAATLDQPLQAVVYGLAAHLVVVFAGVLLASKLSQYPVFGVNPAGIGLVLGFLVLVVVGGLGFTVVGSTVVELGGQPNHWAGLVLGAGIAGGIAVVTPTVAWVAWLAVASVGVGGAVKKWVHASAVQDLAEP